MRRRLSWQVAPRDSGKDFGLGNGMVRWGWPRFCVPLMENIVVLEGSSGATLQECCVPRD